MATYKLVKLHMKNERHTNCFYGSYFLDKWVERVCQCDNMTLTRKSAVGNAEYNAIFNSGTLGLIYNISGVAYFGTRGSSTADYALAGLQCVMSDFVCKADEQESLIGSKNFFPYEMTCDLIIDSDNNLIRSSALQAVGNANAPNWGFLFTNGGLLYTGNNQIYSIGSSPALIKYTEPTNDPYSFLMNYVSAKDETDQFTVYQSDTFVRDTSNYLEVMDHVKFIYSPQLARYQSSGLGEVISVDGNKYVHVGFGYKWIPITAIEHESIEVTAA